MENSDCGWTKKKEKFRVKAKIHHPPQVGIYFQRKGEEYTHKLDCMFDSEAQVIRIEEDKEGCAL